MEGILLEPLKYYESVGKTAHERNVTAHFDDLVERSGVDVAENRATVKKYKAEMATAQKIREKLSRKKALRVLLILAIIACFIAAFVGATKIEENNLLGGLLIGGGVLLGIVGIVLIVKVLNPRIKQVATLLEKHEKKAAELRALAEKQMAPLNALFTDADTLRLIEKTMPQLDFDDGFLEGNHALFVRQFDLVDEQSRHCSVTDTLSGRCFGNPFLYCDKVFHTLGTHTYHGALTIYWTESYIDSKGNRQTRTVSQVLHASVTKPKPYYSQRKTLYYGNQAADELSFSRVPQHSEDLSEKARKRKVRRGAKKLAKKAEKATVKGGNFREMANEEFDVLFGAIDRNHEVQFRTLFTPLAQNNTVDLLTSQTGYGDDFYFTKRRRCNMITSEHAQSWSMDCSAKRYYSYDVDAARRNFTAFNENYFKSLFFDFAPLLAVPAYQEKPVVSLERPEEYPSYYSTYEHEAMANQLGKLLAHREARTTSIMKTDFVCKENGKDRVAVTAYGYTTAERVDLIPRLGGDGKMHVVPVPWTEYIPVERTSQMVIGVNADDKQEQTEENRRRFAADTIFHGLAAWLIE
ncbi:MAG: hypothetical protein IJX31_04730 [Clostridia bacterium]|nr:hypothetical protein [Clostridia bacterium]